MLLTHTPIVLLAGNAGAGKDTAADFLAEKYGAACLSLADPFKRFCKAVFELTDSQLWGPSPQRNEPANDQITHSTGWNQQRQALDYMLHELGVTSEPIKNISFHNTIDSLFDAAHRGKVVSPRTILQTIGGWGRYVLGEDVWINFGLNTATKLLTGNCGYSREYGVTMVKGGGATVKFSVIRDGRYRNEIMRARVSNALALKIIRPDTTRDIGGIANHRSETELDRIPDHFFSGLIRNTSTVDHMYTQLSVVMEEVYGARAT